ncbi:hypothetical protein [Marivirga sp.]|uniref:hypothetical protein n=1 Tax=Marivirga sp. TaxID=2018662 RepID=UPI003DA750EC
MQQLTIDGKNYDITFMEDIVEVEYQDEVTGLKTVLVFEELTIKKGVIKTEVHQFQITPTGERIQRNVYKRTTSEVDRQTFINSPIANLILKFITNGIFRFLIQSTYKVYDMNGNLIQEQPVLPPSE